MMKIKNIVSFIAFLLLLSAIQFGGPRLSFFLTERYKAKINRNATQVTAVVYLKKSHKGRTVHFRYNYKDEKYINNEQDDKWYNELKVGDSIHIALDTTDPSSSYILE